METLKTYLNSLFLQLPDTPKVQKAREEIWQMMEDKYNGYRSGGMSENEAVSKVIAEFGSLEELAEALDVDASLFDASTKGAHPVITKEMAQEYISDGEHYSWLQAIAVGLCIISVIPPILLENAPAGPALMFCLIGAAVAIFIINGIKDKKWEKLKKEGYVPDMGTTTWLLEEQENRRTSYAISMAIGVFLCIFCLVPTMMLDSSSYDFLGLKIHSGNLGASAMFFLAAAGVVLIVKSGLMKSRIHQLLQKDSLSEKEQDFKLSEKKLKETHPIAAEILSVYWPTITAIYLCISFLTFRWATTWLIWPIASVCYPLIHAALRKK